VSPESKATGQHAPQPHDREAAADDAVTQDNDDRRGAGLASHGLDIDPLHLQ